MKSSSRRMLFGTICVALSFSAIFAAAAPRTHRTHIVREGETLFSIAASALGNGGRWTELAARNNLRAPYVIRTGMELVIEDSGAAAPPIAPNLSVTETRAVVVAAPMIAEPATYETSHVSPQLSQPSLRTIDTDPRAGIPATTIETPNDPNAVTLFLLSEAVAIARAHNGEFRAIELGVEASRAKLVSAGLAGRRNPEFEGEVAGRNRLNDPSTTDYSVGIVQEFEIAGQSGRRRNVAELEIELAVASAEARRRGIISEIEDAWVDAIASRERWSVAVENEALRKRIEQAAAERYRIGAAPGMEHSLVEVELAKAAAERRQAFADHRRECERLAVLLGVDGVNVAAGFPVLLEIAFDSSEPLRHRADLRAEEITAKLRSAESRLALSEGASNVTLGGGYRREEKTTDIYYARIGIPLPLTNTGRGRAQEADRLSAAATAQASATRARIIREFRSALDSLNRAAERSRMLEEIALARTRENLELIAEAYREGKVSLTTALVYQGEALAARRLVVEARADWLDAAVRVGEIRGCSILIQGDSQ